MAMPGGRRRLLLEILVSAAVVLGVVFYLQVRRPPAPRRALYIVGNAQRGASLFYGDKQCGICHSVNGSGGRVAPDLSGERPSNPAMGWIVAVLWNHGPGMWRQIGQKNRAYPKMDSQEMADILAFLYHASNVGRPGDPTAGQRVFSEKGCIHCHAVNSQGGKTAPDLGTLPNRGDADAWTSAMLNHAASMVGPITSTLGQWPQFSGTEMNDLIAYVSQGTPQPTVMPHNIRGNAEKGWGVVQARCMPCHTVRGQGGNLGPELGPDRDLPLTTAKFASVMWNHAPAMLQRSREAGIAAPQLQGNEMADLRAFLASLRYFEPTGSPLVGERIFSERGCAACHGPEAQGTKMGPPLKATAEAYTAVSFSAALWRHGPRMIDRAEKFGLSWPTLKAADIGDLVSFLNAPAPPK
jgi:cytochrome c2